MFCWFELPAKFYPTKRDVPFDIRIDLTFPPIVGDTLYFGLAIHPGIAYEVYSMLSGIEFKIISRRLVLGSVSTEYGTSAEYSYKLKIVT